MNWLEGCFLLLPRCKFSVLTTTFLSGFNREIVVENFKSLGSGNVDV
ncbi:MAG: hypothetical protein ABI168_02535 [Ginsengibacter sp.]